MGNAAAEYAAAERAAVFPRTQNGMSPFIYAVRARGRSTGNARSLTGQPSLSSSSGNRTEV